MSKQTKIILIILVSLIVLGLGYWFIYRPYAIKKSCFRQATNYANQKNYLNKDGVFNNYYSICLKAKNL